MARKLDKLLIIDVESTCWKDQAPKNEQSEIIEIGICMIDLPIKERMEKRSILVKPKQSKVSPFCTQLTTLRQEDVDHGIDFQEACAVLKKEYLSKERTWASYGDYDRRQFERQCKDRNIGYPFGPSHINVKNLFAIKHSLPYEPGMAEALKLLKLPLEGTHHRGGDDAWNIASILLKLLF